MGDNVIISMKPKIKGLIPKSYVGIPTARVQYGPEQPVKWDKPSADDIMHFFGFFKVAPGLKLQKSKGFSPADGMKMVDYAKEQKSEYCMPTWDKEDDTQGGIGAKTEYNGDHWANEFGGAVKKVHEALLKDPYAMQALTKQWFGKGAANCVKSCLSRIGGERMPMYQNKQHMEKGAPFGDASSSGMPRARYHYHFDGKAWLVADETMMPSGGKAKFVPVDKWAKHVTEEYINEHAQSLDYFDEAEQEARSISEMQAPLLNKYARQQRLNPKYADPALRSMMDAVAQVYVGKDEDAE